VVGYMVGKRLFTALVFTDLFRIPACPNPKEIFGRFVFGRLFVLSICRLPVSVILSVSTPAKCALM
jgi:hypothetical protein